MPAVDASNIEQIVWGTPLLGSAFSVALFGGTDQVLRWPSSCLWVSEEHWGVCHAVIASGIGKLCITLVRTEEPALPTWRSLDTARVERALSGARPVHGDSF